MQHSTRLALNTLKKLLVPSEFTIVEKVELLKDAFELRTSLRCYHSDLINAQYPSNKLPKEFLDFFKDQIITYPVYIDSSDGLKTVDFRNLLYWWAEHPQHLHKNPFTFQDIQVLQINTELKEILDRFVPYIIRQAQGFTLSDEQVIQALKKIDVYVAEFQNPESCQTRIDRKNLSKQTLDQLIAQNLVNEVIDHPVLVDGTLIMDYQHLLTWWKDHPTRKYQNPFTEMRIKSISYHSEFKYELEKHCAAEARPLYSSQLP